MKTIFRAGRTAFNASHPHLPSVPCVIIDATYEVVITCQSDDDAKRIADQWNAIGYSERADGTLDLTFLDTPSS
jgi:hypothetical protein